MFYAKVTGLISGVYHRIVVFINSVKIIPLRLKMANHKVTLYIHKHGRLSTWQSKWRETLFQVPYLSLKTSVYRLAGINFFSSPSSYVWGNASVDSGVRPKWTDITVTNPENINTCLLINKICFQSTNKCTFSKYINLTWQMQWCCLLYNLIKCIRYAHNHTHTQSQAKHIWFS